MITRIGICILNKSNLMKLRYFFIVVIFTLLSSCGNSVDSGSGKQAVYVKPSIDSRGRYRKGHVRMPVSTRKNAIKSQNRSRYYYQT